jgi:hypothetical protein
MQHPSGKTRKPRTDGGTRGGWLMDDMNQCELDGLRPALTARDWSVVALYWGVGCKRLAMKQVMAELGLTGQDVSKSLKRAEAVAIRYGFSKGKQDE